MQSARGGDWGPDGSIVFTPTPGGSLYRIPADGGTPQPLTRLDEEAGETTHRWPHVLPGGRAVLFVSHDRRGDFAAATIEVLDLGSGKRTKLRKNASFPSWLPPGHVVYVSTGTVWALPFDLEGLEITGQPVPVPIASQ